ncbi:Formyltransferase/hydrolase complex Fhc subunit C [Paraburkholderia hiiakae]|uniref:Formyltransferase/hydrolase complex Fhc subunit C n=1 Tax=Paraburkholderia hiiakae TaxID=1081782 RepID=A0ABM8NU88_9BURK|nr:formylmethanofuran dehydrogenase subunit C [Paraburkholderia hiiakae]CAD6543712.1 Formyltransferase/hydrolase complex Fhc subunit C [Paraburkholderia hiiakae]
MKRTTLRIKQPPALRIDARTLLPVTLAALDKGEIERLPLWHGTERIVLADLFEVSAQTTPECGPCVVFEGDMRRFDRIGSTMEAGAIVVEGGVGDLLGVQMRAGEIIVRGGSGSFAACEMAGGRIEIGGNCGDFASAALPGSMDGMRGGTLVVRGDAGERLGDRMRRGTVLVFGNAGAFAASRMVAGTLGIAGSVGEHLAYGMRRGSLILPGVRALSGTHRFVENHADVDVFWRLITRSLAREGGAFGELAQRAPLRFVGDVSVGGKGELLFAG